MMASNRTDSTSALSALDARKAVRALIEFRRDGVKDSRLTTAVEDVLASLDAFSGNAPLFANLSSGSAFQSYEQLQTLREVQTALSDDLLTNKLRNLIADAPAEDLGESVESAIRFFTAVAIELSKDTITRLNKAYKLITCALSLSRSSTTLLP